MRGERSRAGPRRDRGLCASRGGGELAGRAGAGARLGRLGARPPGVRAAAGGGGRSFVRSQPPAGRARVRAAVTAHAAGRAAREARRREGAWVGMETGGAAVAGVRAG